MFVCFILILRTDAQRGTEAGSRSHSREQVGLSFLIAQDPLKSLFSILELGELEISGEAAGDAAETLCPDPWGSLSALCLTTRLLLGPTALCPSIGLKMPES